MKNFTLNTAILLIILLTLTNLTNAQWVQIGDDIDGEYFGDYSGRSVLDSTGSIVAIGANQNFGNDFFYSYRGHVRVYKYNNGNWIQLGSDIDGEAIEDLSGCSLSLSSDGTIVAIGAIWNDGNGYAAGHVRVYEYSGGNWVQIGNDIDGEAAQDKSGCSVDLSSDGNIVAIGAKGNNSNTGHVRIYQFNGTNWTLLGNDIDGEVTDDYSGSFVCLNSDGSIVGIGADKNDGSGVDAGHVRIFEYSSGNWVQMGTDIDGEAADDHSGNSVSLSSDGSIVAIGARYNDGNGSNSGHVRIYEYSGGNWVQIGNDIDGEATDDESGFSVSLSSDGSIVAIGAFSNDGSNLNSGHVRIYEYSGGSWIQIGSDIDGEASDDNFGWSVSLSFDGSIVAIGAPWNDGNGIEAGHVRVYGYTTGINEYFSNTEINIYPNPTNGKITVKAKGVERIEVMDITGKTIKNTVIASKAKQSANKNEIATGYHPRNDEIDLSQQPSGIYIIKVTTKKGVVVRKIILK